MNRSVVSIVVLVALFSFTTLSYSQSEKTAPKKAAEAKADIVRGTVVSIDAAKNAIVVKEKKSGTEKTIMAAPADIAPLKVGENVKAVLKEGTNTAESIKVVQPHTGMAGMKSKKAADKK